MGRLFLSVLIGMIVMLVMNDGVRDDLNRSLHTAAEAFAAVVRQ